MPEHQHTVSLPRFSRTLENSAENARNVVQLWVESFHQALKGGTVAELSAIFHNDAWIRDFLGFSWDFRTIQGSNELAKYMAQHQGTAGVASICPREKGDFQPVFKQPAPGVHWVESMFDFETSVGRGKGMLRLVADDNSIWRAYLINFTLQELKGFEEMSGSRRPHGYHDPRSGTWSEKRAREKEFLDEDPVVLVIGAGMSKLASPPSKSNPI